MDGRLLAVASPIRAQRWLRNVGYWSSAAVSKRAKVPGKAVESGLEARLAY